MGNENGVGAWTRRGAQHSTKGLAPAFVLVRRHNEAALGEVSRFFDVFEASQHGCLVSPVVFAGIDLADGNASEMKTAQSAGVRNSGVNGGMSAIAKNPSGRRCFRLADVRP